MPSALICRQDARSSKLTVEFRQLYAVQRSDGIDGITARDAATMSLELDLDGRFVQTVCYGGDAHAPLIALVRAPSLRPAAKIEF